MRAEATPELFVAGDEFEILVQPRLSTANRGSGQADLREAHISGRAGDADYLVGSTILFWGKPRSITRSTSSTAAISAAVSSAVKSLAPPWHSCPFLLARQIDLMTIDFVANIYPERPLRERIGPKVNNGTPTFSGKADKNDIATAIRWSGYAGDLDIGISWFRGTGNAPRLRPE